MVGRWWCSGRREDGKENGEMKKWKSENMNEEEQMNVCVRGAIILTCRAMILCLGRYECREKHAQSVFSRRSKFRPFRLESSDTGRWTPSVVCSVDI